MSRRRVTDLERRYVLARAAFKCEACGDCLDATYDIDHIVPRWKGGRDHVSNYQVLHAKCHRVKTLAEELDRTTNVTMPCMWCSRCGVAASPYFAHTCET